jgi:hypothetical protein
MDLDQLHRMLDELEPGMSMTIPKDWVSANVSGGDETERDLATIELVLACNCTWERDPEARHLTFEKQPAGEKTA